MVNKWKSHARVKSHMLVPAFKAYTFYLWSKLYINMDTISFLFIIKDNQGYLANYYHGK